MPPPILAPWLSALTPAPRVCTPFPYTTLFRSGRGVARTADDELGPARQRVGREVRTERQDLAAGALAHLVVLDRPAVLRSGEHTSELQSPCNLVCRLLLDKKKSMSSVLTYALS